MHTWTVTAHVTNKDGKSFSKSFKIETKDVKMPKYNAIKKQIEEQGFTLVHLGHILGMDK